MPIGTTNFPTTLDDATSLIRAANLASSTIDTGGVTNSATTVPVVSATTAPADGVAWCGTEAIAYTGKTTNTLTGCTRGFDNTTAASHAAGDVIYYGPAIAARFNVLQNALIAVQTLLGAGGANVGLRLPRSSKTVALGDSITAGNIAYWTAPAGNISWFTHAALASNSRIFHHFNAGVTGNTLAQMDARFATDVTAKAPGRVIIMGGTNDSATTLASMKATVQSITTKAIAANIEPVWLAVTPRDAASQDATYRNKISTFNAWLSLWCAWNGYRFVDTFSPLADALTGNIVAGLTIDGLHPNGRGARMIGQIVAAALSDIPPSVWMPQPAWTNEGFNLLVNGQFSVDTNADGLSDSWLTTGSGATTKTRVADPDLTGGFLQRLTMTAQTADSGIYQPISTGFTPGDTLLFTGYISTSGNEAGGASGEAIAFWQGSTGISSSSLYGSNANVDGIFSIAVPVPTGTTSINMALRLNIQSSPATGVASFGRVSVINLTTLGVS